jgi:hypothetical protein
VLGFTCAVAACSSTKNSATPSGDDASNAQGDDSGTTGDDNDTTGDDGSTTAGDDSATGGDGAVAVASDSGGNDGAKTGNADGGSEGSTTTTESDATTYEGGIAPSTCIAALYSTYIVRTDGILIWENTPSSPETIRDASTGNPLTGILNVQEATYHGCAAVSSGMAECWQTNASDGNTSGQLGNGTTTASAALYSATPVLTGPSAPLMNVTAVATGNTSTSARRSSCAVTNDGKIWCWGDLTWLVNNGTTLVTGYAQAITTNGSTPFTGVSSAALGYAEACAIVGGSTNSVWCWGYNGEGELGQSDTTARQYPTKVLGLTNPSKIVSSPSYEGDTFCALDGSSVKCWGSNFYQQAGSNTTTNPLLGPTQVVVQSGSGLANVVDIQGGSATFAALLSTNTMWNWGAYATNYGLTNVLAIGWAGPSGSDGPRFVTSDGVYHSAMTNVTVNCNAM